MWSYSCLIEQWCGTLVVGYLNTGEQWPDLTILTIWCFYWAVMWYISCGLSKYWSTVTWSYHSHLMVLLLSSDVVHQLWAIKILEYSDLILPFSLYGDFIEQWCGTPIVGYLNTGVQWPDLTILTVWCFYWAVMWYTNCGLSKYWSTVTWSYHSHFMVLLLSSDVVHQLWAIKILEYSDLILPFSLYGDFIEQWCGTPIVGYQNTGVQWPDLTILTVWWFYWAVMWYTNCGLSKYWCTVTWSYHSHFMVLLLSSDVVNQLWAIKVLEYSDLILPFSLYNAFIEQWCDTSVVGYLNTVVQWLDLTILTVWCFYWAVMWYTSCGLSKYWCTVTWSYHSHCTVLLLSKDVVHQLWAI